MNSIKKICVSLICVILLTSCVKEIDSVVVEEMSEEVVETTRKLVSTIKAHEETETTSKLKISNFDDFFHVIS